MELGATSSSLFDASLPGSEEVTLAPGARSSCSTWTEAASAPVPRSLSRSPCVLEIPPVVSGRCPTGSFQFQNAAGAVAVGGPRFTPEWFAFPRVAAKAANLSSTHGKPLDVRTPGVWSPGRGPSVCRIPKYRECRPAPWWSSVDDSDPGGAKGFTPSNSARGTPGCRMMALSVPTRIPHDRQGRCRAIRPTPLA